MDVFDLTTKTWSVLQTKGGVPRTEHTAYVYNDKMYVYGGIFKE